MNNLQHSPTAVNLHFQGGLVQIKVPSTKVFYRIGAPRGRVNKFSRASRLRLLRLFSTLGVDHAPRAGASFLTLTYPSEFPSPAVAKNHLRAFLERIRRHFPAASAVWRLEFQRRGAPHFHLVVFGLPFIPKRAIQRVWGSIIGYAKVFTRIELIRDRRKLMGYASKYLAKSDGGFNIDAYLHGDKFIHPQTGEITGSVGRWWGVHNRPGLPYCPAIVTTFDGSKSILFQFRRGARKRYSKVGGGTLRGFTIFVDNSSRWFDYWLSCCLGGG